MLTTRRIGFMLALLTLCMLGGGCTQSWNREVSFTGTTECEERDCGCGTIEIATVSGGELEMPGEVIRSFVLEGLVVVATATPRPGWAFSHWSGDAAGEQSSTEVFADQGKDVIAHFERIRPLRTLELRVIGDGGVDGGYCFPQNTQLAGGGFYTPSLAEYGDGEILSLSAFPAGAFVGWTGYGVENEIKLVMDQDRSITALFYDGHAHPHGSPESWDGLSDSEND